MCWCCSYWDLLTWNQPCCINSGQSVSSETPVNDLNFAKNLVLQAAKCHSAPAAKESIDSLRISGKKMWSFKYLACLSQHTQQNWTPVKTCLLCPILLTLSLLVGSRWRAGHPPSETADPHGFDEKGHMPILFGQLQWLYRWISGTFQPFRRL